MSRKRLAASIPAGLGLALIVLIAPVPPAHAVTHGRHAGAPAFGVRRIGRLSASATFVPHAVSDGGIVVGTMISASPPAGFFWRKGKVHGVKTPKGLVGTSLLDINGSNVLAAAGCVDTACDVTRAYGGVIRNGRVTLRKLPRPKGASQCAPPGCSSIASGIGPTGDIAGQFDTRAVLWTGARNGTYAGRRLPFTDPQRFTTSSALQVDSFGDVIGTEASTDGVRLGVFWPHRGEPRLLLNCANVLVRGGTTIDAPAGLAAKGKPSHRVVSVAGRCLVVSTADNVKGRAPAVWRVKVTGSSATTGKPKRLDSTDGSDAGGAVAINTKGWIVGNEGDAGSTAALWTNGQPLPLNGLLTTPGWTADMPAGMNKRGQIVGIGTQNGHTAPFLLTPE